MIEFHSMPPDFFDPIPEQQLSFSLTLPHFVIRMSTGEYLTRVRIVSNYVEYQFTTNRDEASVLNDFDSQLVLKRLRTLGERSEEHTSELQSQSNLVCRLLL